MKIELCRASGGANFAVYLTGERSGKQIIIPLSQQLSEEIDRMIHIEVTGTLILPEVAHVR